MWISSRVRAFRKPGPVSLQSGEPAHRSVVQVFLSVASWTILASFVLMARELFIASSFGAGPALDAFLIAFLIPTYAVTIIAGSLSAAFIPIYIERRREAGIEAAQRLFASAFSVSLWFLLFMSVILAVLSPALLRALAAGFDPALLRLSQSLFLLMLPAILLRGITSVWSALLHAEARFSEAAIARVTFPLPSIVALLLFDPSIRWLTATTVAGFLMETLIVGWAVKRQGFSLRPKWRGPDDALREMGRQYGAVVAGSCVLGGTIITDSVMATLLGAGSVSILNYANRAVSFVLAISAVPLSTAVLPYFSRLVAEEDWRGIRSSIRSYRDMILLLSVPLTAVLIATSGFLVRLLFERGAFTASDSSGVTATQIMLLLQVPFYLVGIVVVRVISSLREAKLLVAGAVLSFVLNVVLNLVFMNLYGVAGLGLATSVVYAVSTVFLTIMTQRALTDREVACRTI